MVGRRWPEIVEGQGAVQGPDVLNHGGLSGGDAVLHRGRTTGGIGLPRGGPGSPFPSKYLPELEAQNQDQQGQRGYEKPTGQLLLGARLFRVDVFVHAITVLLGIQLL